LADSSGAGRLLGISLGVELHSLWYRQGRGLNSRTTHPLRYRRDPDSCSEV
jgi:hypothetical protein